MVKRLRFVIGFIILLFLLSISTPIIADSIGKKIIDTANLFPSNTVIISNQFDARFSRDFSVLLKRLRLEWVVLDSAVMPDSILEKNLILLGHLDSEYVGQVIRGMLSEEEIETLQVTKNGYLILEKESPWADDRTIFICLGANFIDRRDAAEELIHTIIADVPPTSDWIRTAYAVDVDEQVRIDISHLQYQFSDPELPLQHLAIDMDAKTPRKITYQEAVSDVERLFYLLSHGYSGYAFFTQNGNYEIAEKNILEQLSSQSSWSRDAFASLLHEHLSFIVDFHMSIEGYKFAEHNDFWYAPDFYLTLDEDGFHFEVDNKNFTLDSINGADPTPFILPSINREGDPIYRLGLLSTEEPQSLMIAALSEEGPREFKVNLQSSNFNYYSNEVFREDSIGGIPVIRVRGFGDADPDELTKFVETGKRLLGEPVVIVDIRGNGGGNERWPSLWIQGLTGKRPNSVFVFSELESQTSMIGRANAFVYWSHQVNDPTLFSPDADRYTSIAESIENGTRESYWTGPRYPQIPLISNDTTVIVITNGLVASAGEGFVMRISQIENVVVIGENTMGALTFGNISTHQLPNSKLTVWLPINLNLFPNLESLEGVGLAPDLWVPAADAVNYSVAAIRQGTITTYQPLSQEALQTKFVPESPLQKLFRQGFNFWMVILLFGIGGVVFANYWREKPRLVLAVGSVWVIVSLYYLNQNSEKPIGYGLICTGIICFVWGGLTLIKKGGKPQSQIAE